MDADWLQGLCEVLNPAHEPGRLVLIHRMGAEQIEARLPALIEAVRATGVPVLWVCDPMHGNTETTQRASRRAASRTSWPSSRAAFRIHSELGSYLGGVHFELTGEDVTECTGGARGLADADLARAYRSQVDPRLNYEQALELAMRIAGSRPVGLSRPAAEHRLDLGARHARATRPGARPSTRHGPTPMRTSRRVGRPDGSGHAAHLSVAAFLTASSSSQAVGMVLRTRIGGSRGQSQAGSGDALRPGRAASGRR